MNNHRVAFGLLYDTKDRTLPFRWKGGHMTVLEDLTGAYGRRTFPTGTRSTKVARLPEH